MGTRNNISLSVDTLPNGRFKVRWREPVEVDGKLVVQARSRTVSDKAARDALVNNIRRKLEAGEVFKPEARKEVTAANLELAALAWLRAQQAKGKKTTTREKYKAAIARIMQTIRRVKKIPFPAPIPVSVLDVDLFSSILIVWTKEDSVASAAKTRKNACSPMRRYHLAGFLYAVWSFAASQPSTYPGVPPLVDRTLVIPGVPPQPGAPEAATWAECDAVVRRAYAVSVDLGDLLAGQRLTGLRIGQVEAIRRRAIDPVRLTLVVETGKSQAEEAEKRKIPIPQQLVDLWQARIAACSDPDAFLFPSARSESGHIVLQPPDVSVLWLAAEKAGEVRPGMFQPHTRRKARPTHGFRAAYMAGLQSITVEVDGSPVQRVSDRSIDFLVGHRPADTRGKHYAPPTWDALVAAVGHVAPIDLRAPVVAAGGNVVQLDDRRR